ncbi:MAG: hypothetical protein HDR95_03845 [Bacteroides sp.]|nr:hypothetical protein [Bacteroides sp.]
MKGDKITYSKTKNAAKGIGAGVINKIVTLVLPFIVRTLLIKYIGIDYAGLNGLYSSLLEVLNIAELGFSGAVVYSMYKPIAENDENTICALLNFYRRIYKIIGIGILSIGFIALPFLPKLINGTPPPGANIYILFILYLTSTSVSYLLYGYKISLLNAYQRVDIIQHIGTVISVLTSVLQISVILLFDNFYAYVIIIPILSIVRNIITSRIVDSLFPQYQCRGKISSALKSDIRKKVAGLSIQKICMVSRNGVANIFISAFISLEIVGIYNNYYMIFGALTGILSLIPLSMTAGIGNFVQTSSVEENHKAMEKFNMLYMLISTICAVCLFSLYQPFMEVWLGKKYLLDNSTIILLVIYFYILKMGDIRSIWVDAAGLYWEIKWRAILEAGLNLVLCYIFIRIWGINGLILGTLISLFLINFLYSSSITFKYYFGYSKLFAFYSTQILHFGIMMAICGCAFYLFDKIEMLIGITNIWQIIGYRLILSILLSVISLYIIFHRTTTFKEAQNWIKSKVSR